MDTQTDKQMDTQTKNHNAPIARCGIKISNEIQYHYLMTLSLIVDNDIMILTPYILFK